jgi:hypothetical protein
MFHRLLEWIKCACTGCEERDRQEEPGRAQLRLAVETHQKATEDASQELSQSRLISRYQLSLANEALAISDRAIQRKR